MPVVLGRTAQQAMEDSMELGIAAKPGLERGVEHGALLPVSIEIEKPLDALAVAKVHEGEASLLMEEPAEAAGAESRVARQIGKRTSGSVVANQARYPLHGGMNVLHGNVACVLKALPGEQQSVGDAGIEKGLMPGCGEIGEKISEALHVLLREAPASVAVDAGLEQRAGGDVDGDASNHPAAKDADPHAEVAGLLNKDVFLRGKEPEQVSSADFVAAVAEQVDAPAAGDEIEFEFGMGMATIGGGEIVVLPDAAIQLRLQMQMLTHDKKR